MAPRTGRTLLVSVTVRYGMKSVIASCLAVTVAAVAFRSSKLRDETLWWEEKFVVSKTEHWYVKCPDSDDATWYHKNRGPDFDCAWVAQKPDTRCSVNGVTSSEGEVVVARDACAAACSESALPGNFVAGEKVKKGVDPECPYERLRHDGGCYASLDGCKILEHYLKPTLETCDPANERSVICDGATANRAFFENGGYRGQSCGDRDVLTQWFHDLHFGEVGDDLGQFGWAFHDLGLREEEYVHTWDREAYLRAIATEPRWMEVLDRLCADQI